MKRGQAHSLRHVIWGNGMQSARKPDCFINAFLAMTSADAVRALRVARRSSLGFCFRASRAVALVADRLRADVRVYRPNAALVARLAHRLGVRRRAIRRWAELDCDGLHFPIEHARVVGLGRGRPFVTLPGDLSRYGGRPGLAFRSRQSRRTRTYAWRRVGRHRMAARDD